MENKGMGQGTSQPFDIHDLRTTNCIAPLPTMETSLMSKSVPTDHERGIDDVDNPLPEIPPETGDASTIPSSPCNVTAPDTSDKSPPPSETSEEPRDCQWTLRPSTCRKRNTDIAWYDHDKSGDYDPLEEAKRLRPKKKAKASVRENREDDDEHGLGIVTKSKPILEVRLSFQSSSARAAFSQMCADQQSKANSAPDHFTEGYQLRKRESAVEPEPLDAPGTRVTTLRNSPFSLPDDLSNRPAARGCYGCLAMGLQCSLLESEHEWPCHDCKEYEDDCQLVTEPTLKRACTHCQYLGRMQKWRVCSFDYEQDASEHRGPCKQCLEDGHQPCIAGPRPGETRTRIRIRWDGEKYVPHVNQPIRAPKSSKTVTCRQCLEARRLCSFASKNFEGDEHTCTACDMSGLNCEPLGTLRGPRPQSKPWITASEDTVDSDVEEEQDILPDSKHNTPIKQQSSKKPEVPGTNERVVASPSKNNASSSGNGRYAITISPEPPRRSRTKQRIETTEDAMTISPDPPKRGRSEERAKATEDVISISSGSSSPNRMGNNARQPISISPDPPNHQGGTIKYVRTRLCHPIRFNRSMSSDGEQHCQFCDSAQFGLLGLEERTVKVLEQRDGSKWVEISGGHRAEGVPPTRICKRCTRARLDMALCVGHKLRRISKRGETDFRKAFDLLIHAGRTVEERWCSVCCNLAAYKCRTKHQRSYGEGEGCGLLLCKHCAGDLAEHGGMFDAMLQDLSDESTEEREAGLRADCELLKHDGLLMKCFFR